MFRQRRRSGHSSILVFCVLVGIFVLGGCSSGINEALFKRVGQEVEFNGRRGDAGRYRGQPLVLEGWITRLRPSGELTVLEVTAGGESWDSTKSFLRSRREVLVIHRGSLNPAIYCPGRLVRIVGVIREESATPGRDAPALVVRPVLEAKSIQLRYDRTAFRPLAPSSSFLYSHDPFPYDPFPPNHPSYGSFHRTSDPFHRPSCD